MYLYPHLILSLLLLVLLRVCVNTFVFIIQDTERSGLASLSASNAVTTVFGTAGNDIYKSARYFKNKTDDQINQSPPLFTRVKYLTVGYFQFRQRRLRTIFEGIKTGLI